MWKDSQQVSSKIVYFFIKVFEKIVGHNKKSIFNFLIPFSVVLNIERTRLVWTENLFSGDFKHSFSNNWYIYYSHIINSFLSIEFSNRNTL